MDNIYWKKKYQQMIRQLATDESEEKALKLLNEGAGIIEAQERSGLSYVKFMELLARADRYEREEFCVSKKVNYPDTDK